MLKLKNITKTYVNKKDSSKNVIALKDVTLELPRQGFVSILGPSGCGKTTLLNILGGLDTKYAGEFLVEGVPTKSFKPHDWDAYRNNHVGFVFQEYNLIPHQNISKNVELVLTIAGASKIEAKRNSRKVLADVGLQDKIMSNSNELSGGQKQRVAIARAIVNNPELVLADEPTSALDSKTSAQVMQVLKEISKTKLVVMVTHNVELAKKYSSRIIRILDGKIEADENLEEPSEREEFLNKLPQRYKYGKSKMKLKTAAALSLKNLTSKKRRSILTVLAGSIGITCLAIILGIINGSTSFIKDLYNNMNDVPLPIPSYFHESIGLKEYREATNEVKNDLEEEEKKAKSNSKINTKQKSSESVNRHFGRLEKYKINNLNANFKSYLLNKLKEHPNIIRGIDFVRNAGASFVCGNGKDLKHEKLDKHTHSLFKEMPNIASFSDGYEFVGQGSKMPVLKEEVIIAVNSLNSLSHTFSKALNIEENKEFEAKDLLGKEIGCFVPNNEIYRREGERFIEKNSPEELKNVYNGNNVVKLKIVGVVKRKAEKEKKGGRFSRGEDVLLPPNCFIYSNALGDFIEEQNKNSEIVQEQLKRDEFVLRGPEETLLAKQDKVLEQKDESIKKINKLKNLSSLGYCENLSGINIYINNLGDNEEKVLNYITAYNEGKEEKDQIKLTEWGPQIKRSSESLKIVSLFLLLTIGLASLLTSLIMVALLEFISVLERTREIGILRSIGARKKDISRLFKSEAVIIGFFTGITGVVAGFLISIPLNFAVNKMMLNGEASSVKLVNINILVFLGLLLFSLVVNLLAGLIPAKIASRKDPIKILVGSNN